MKRHTRALALLGALAIVAAAVVWVHHLLQRPFVFVDLDVYRWGGQHVRDHGSIYDGAAPGTNLQFTYPPFAALLFAGAAKLGLLHRWSFTVVSLLALARSAWILAANRGTLLRGLPTWIVAIAFAGTGAFVEPGSQNLILGQVSFLLLWLVLEALLGAGRGRPLGAVGIGIAAAVKLTPALFVVWLLVERRWRAAAAAIAAFVAAAAGAWLVVPADSHDFWLGDGLRANRVGSPEYLANQSINGELWRLAGHGGITWLWAVVSLLVVGACCWIAHRSNAVAALGLIGLASVLVAPISWTHHWVIVLPLLVGLAGADVIRYRRTLHAGLALCTLVFASRIVWHAPQGGGREFHLHGRPELYASTYVLMGFVLIAVAWWTTRSTARDQ